MEPITVFKDGFCISTDHAKLDLKAIHHFLSTASYWSRNIPFEKVAKAAAHSLNFGLYYQDKQIGYARIISDYTSIAYLGDVYVLEEFRGKGLSKWLMQTIKTHPQLQGLRRWILATKDAHGLYKQFGFTALAGPERWMELHNKEVYENQAGK
jgi:GNAT superfamily N-acetyltransferase